MTSEKLTAKLSDGTEWKVVSNEPTAKGSENRVVWLMPLKPSPPKEVFLCVYSDGSVSATYLTAEDASKYALGLSAPYPVHRYTLAPEPGLKESRRVFHLHFRKNGQLLRAVEPIEKGMRVVVFEDKLFEHEYAHEVIRVRQCAE